MAVHYDEKGKYFTDVVTKRPLGVIIQTDHGRVFGTVHITPDHRLLDEVNLPGAFLPVTQARIADPQVEIRTSLLALNKRQIVWVGTRSGGRPGEVGSLRVRAPSSPRPILAQHRCFASTGFPASTQLKAAHVPDCIPGRAESNQRSGLRLGRIWSS